MAGSKASITCAEIIDHHDEMERQILGICEALETEIGADPKLMEEARALLQKGFAALNQAVREAVAFR